MNEVGINHSGESTAGLAAQFAVLTQKVDDLASEMRTGFSHTQAAREGDGRTLRPARAIDR